MVEPLLTGIVLGLMAVTLLGLFVAAYLQFKRGNELELKWDKNKSTFVRYFYYQLAFVTPGKKQSCANSRTTFLHNPK